MELKKWHSTKEYLMYCTDKEASNRPRNAFYIFHEFLLGESVFKIAFERSSEQGVSTLDVFYTLEEAKEFVESK